MAASELAPVLGVRRVCAALQASPATFYRRRQTQPSRSRRSSPRALSTAERAEALRHLESERFVDSSVRQVYYQLLDEGVHLCSPRTMYRLLAERGEVRERRRQLSHPQAPVPRLRADAPNRVWTWDITKLRTMDRWRLLYLYVILDLFSRYVVGWLLAERESAVLARQLLADTAAAEGIERQQLVVHADRGQTMTAKTLAQLLVDLGIERSHSRPRTSNDNAFSESQFKTLKHAPDFPSRFDDRDHGHRYCRSFFHWYNYEHRHSGIAYLTPADVHHGQAPAVLAQRELVLHQAYERNPIRFVRGRPSPIALPNVVTINPEDSIELP